MSFQQANSNFSYEGLANNAIRLLQVHREAGGIKCDLHHVRLDEKPSFRALSYVWGPVDNPATITVNGSPFQITRNLHHALLEYRRRQSPEEVQYLWVDAICINQTNLAEKAIQVPLMTTIYGACDGVLPWLGPVAPEQDDDFHILAGTLRAIQHREEGVDDIRSFVLANLKEALGSAGGNSEAELLERVKTPLLEMSSRPWFRRVWIAQEIVLAQDPVNLLVGSHELPYDAFLLAWMSLLGPNAEISYYWSAGHPLDFLTLQAIHEEARHWEDFQGPDDQAVHKRRTQECAQSLLQLINATTSLGATVPHDYVFGLLGLLKCERLPEALTVDYTKSFAEVYHRVLVFLLLNAQDSRALDLGALGQLGPDVPSWVPDLRERFDVQIDTKQPGSAYFSISADFKVLETPAILIGECISCFGPVNLEPIQNRHAPDVLQEHESQIIELASALRGVDSSLVEGEWLRSVLEPILGSSLLDRDPRAVSNFAAAYDCMRREFSVQDLDPDSGNSGPLLHAEKLLSNRQLQTSLFQHGWYVLGNGRIGSVHSRLASVEENDLLCALPGLTSLVVLRPVDDSFRVVASSSLLVPSEVDRQDEVESMSLYQDSFDKAHLGEETMHEVRSVCLI